MPGLIPLETAIQQLLADIDILARVQTCTTADALGKILSNDVVAQIDVPGFDNSAVDGYALNIDHLSSQMAISQRIAAGDSAEASLEQGTAARIFTGAKIPSGANAVVMQEDCLQDGSNVTIHKAEIRPSENIRPAGQDVKQGATMLEAGTVLSPIAIALFSGQGISEVTVYEPLRVAYFSTGDELLEPGDPIVPGKIYNSNRFLLAALIRKLGMTPVDLGRVSDNLSATKAALLEACKQADVVITTGGASVGDEDHMKPAIESLGTLDFWRIAIKPGKPFMKGAINDTTILGLPGNPSAVLATFMLLVRPLLLKAQGAQTFDSDSYALPIDFDVARAGKRREFLRVQKTADGRLVKHPNQSSGMMSSAHWADGLAEIKEGKTYQAGDIVRYLPFSSLWHA